MSEQDVTRQIQEGQQKKTGRTWPDLIAELTTGAPIWLLSGAAVGIVSIVAYTAFFMEGCRTFAFLGKVGTCNEAGVIDEARVRQLINEIDLPSPRTDEEINSLVDPKLTGIGLPKGVVIASTDQCASLGSGWRAFEAGQGRFIVGVGSTTDERGDTRRFSIEDEPKGEFQHMLTDDEMPSHSHGAGSLQASDSAHSMHNSEVPTPQFQMDHKGNLWDTREGRRPNFGGHAHVITGETGNTGGSLPHNNMPPYIALYFCKKEG